MSERIDTYWVEILTTDSKPPMDSAGVMGELTLNGHPWKYRSQDSKIATGKRYQVIGEKTEDEHGRYLRVHKILSEEQLRH